MEQGDAHAPMSDLEPGTVQRRQLQIRISDIAWTALCVLLALWALWGAVGIFRGVGTAWAYCLAAAVLFVAATGARIAATRRRHL
ncbi:hypothetical protein [Streptomyces sp. NPDC060194]|uniref:hypothetical protein n=1 Tax=Streptomyces sp. NPDC060194 TaxID=3347069 RepID=UPI0036471DA3